MTPELIDAVARLVVIATVCTVIVARSIGHLTAALDARRRRIGRERQQRKVYRAKRAHRRWKRWHAAAAAVHVARVAGPCRARASRLASLAREYQAMPAVAFAPRLVLPTR